MTSQPASSIVTTEEVTTEPGSTHVSTEEMTSQPASSVATIEEVTTEPGSTHVSTEEMTSQPQSTVDKTQEFMQPMSTDVLTAETTATMASTIITTEEVTSQPQSTAYGTDALTKPASADFTTEEITTNLPLTIITSQEMTQSTADTTGELTEPTTTNEATGMATRFASTVVTSQEMTSQHSSSIVTDEIMVQVGSTDVTTDGMTSEPTSSVVTTDEITSQPVSTMVTADDMTSEEASTVEISSTFTVTGEIISQPQSTLGVTTEMSKSSSTEVTITTDEIRETSDSSFVASQEVKSTPPNTVVTTDEITSILTSADVATAELFETKQEMTSQHAGTMVTTEETVSLTARPKGITSETEITVITTESFTSTVEDMTTELGGVTIITEDISTQAIGDMASTEEMTSEQARTTSSTEEVTTGYTTIEVTTVVIPDVEISSVSLSLDPGFTLREWSDPVRMDFDLTAALHPNTSAVHGSGLWQLFVSLSDTPEPSNKTYLAPVDVSPEQRDQSGIPGGELLFNGSHVSLDLRGLICPEMTHVCVEIQRDASSEVTFSVGGERAACLAVPCRGVEFTTSVQLETIVREGVSAQPVIFNLTLDPDPRAGSIEGTDLFKVTSFFSLSSVGSPTESSLGQTVHNVTHLQSLYAGLPMTLELVGSLNMTDKMCRDIGHFCVAVEKNGEATVNFTFSDDVVVCIPAICKGVDITDTRLALRAGKDVNEHSSGHQFSMDITLIASADFGNAVGTNLWNVTVYVSPVNNATELRFAETVAEIPTSMRSLSLLGGSNAVLQGVSAEVDLTEVDCRYLKFVCAEVSRGLLSVPEFTLSGSLQECTEITCRGVEITNTDIEITQGDSFVERSGLHQVTFDLTLSSNPITASISGDRLWEVDVFLTEAEFDSENAKVSSTPALELDTEGADLSAGIPLTLGGIEAFLDFSTITCSDSLYVCVTLFRGRNASPYFTLTGNPDSGILTACQQVSCTGLIVTATKIYLAPEVYVLEYTDSQAVNFDVTLSGSQEGASITGSDLWSLTAQVIAYDGTLLDQSIGMIPADQTNSTLAAGGDLTLSNIETLVSLGNEKCSHIAEVCVIVAKNSIAEPDYTLEVEESMLRNCTDVSCRGVLVTQVVPTIAIGNVIAEGDTDHSITVDVTMTSSPLGTGRTGSGSWRFVIFLTNNVNSGDKLVQVAPAITAEQAETELASGGSASIVGLRADFDTSSLRCTDYSHICVTLNKGIRPNPDFTLSGTPDNDAFTGCVEISCEALKFDSTVTALNTTWIDLSWNEPSGDFNNYYVIVSPRDGLSSPVILPSNTTTFRLEDLTPGQEYRIEINIAEDGSLKGTQGEILSQRTVPEAVTEFSVTAVASTSIDVSWANPGGVFSQYDITFDPVHGSTPGTFVLPADQDSFSFQGLTPMTEYTVTIATISGSLRSETITTKAVTDSIRPTIQVTSFSTSAITVGIAVNDLITHGNIELSYFPTDALPNPIELNINASEYTIANLVAGRRYSIQAKIVADVGGAQVSSTSATASQRTEPDSPGALNLTEATENSIAIAWGPTSGDYDYHRVFVSPTPLNVQLPIWVPFGSPEETRVTGLNSATTYTFTVATESGGLISTSVSATFNTVPAPPGPLSSGEVTSRSISVFWSAAPGGLTLAYVVTYAPTYEGITAQSPSVTTNDTNFAATGLSPYTLYTFSVRTVLGVLISREVRIVLRTLPDVPSAVSVFNITIDSPYQATFSIGLPDEPSGVISLYVLTVTGSKGGEANNTLTIEIEPSLSGDVTVYQTDQLTAGFTYNVVVQAQNAEGLGPGLRSGVFTMPIYAPPPPDESQVSEASRFLESSSSSIRIQITDDIFDNRNGEVTSYVVLVTEDGGENQAVPANPLTYNDVKDLDVWPPYQTSAPFNPFGSSESKKRRRREVTQVSYYVIGSEDCREGQTYCNGPLRPSSKYRYAFRGFNELGDYTDTPWSSPQETGIDPLWILYAVVGGVVAIGVILAVCLCCYRYANRTTKGPPPPYSVNGYVNDGFLPVSDLTKSSSTLQTLSIKRTKTSRPIPLTVFREYVKLQSDDHRKGFEDEYDELRRLTRNKATHIGQLLENRPKNRYANILPYDHNRVRLSGRGQEDYINASYIAGSHGPCSYIAAQSPLEETVDDFWRMVWQEKVSTIVMMTQCVEGGKAKCHPYWPADDTPRDYSGIEVRVTLKTTLPEWKMTDLSLEKNGEVRSLRQFQCTLWPISGSPHEGEAIMRLVQTVRSQITDVNSPLLVHCSAGVGRTAVFIALDRLLENQSSTVDIFGTVANMRRQRPNMVLTQSQYEFLYYSYLQTLREVDVDSNWSFRRKTGENWTLTSQYADISSTGRRSTRGNGRAQGTVNGNEPVYFIPYEYA
ncbi:uncharacterized protein [Ptychodera flava]|uniref:uncharacterized protein n=1 Tax=Ptychodera flava TaxID=63121 RepID=UPI003969FA06